ncbi:unnamed protein product [Closterium sp. Naga37s-1]|nr:unnamed protein product [Closterium sp. Naga37s-1]
MGMPKPKPNNNKAGEGDAMPTLQGATPAGRPASAARMPRPEASRMDPAEHTLPGASRQRAQGKRQSRETPYPAPTVGEIPAPRPLQQQPAPAPPLLEAGTSPCGAPGTRGADPESLPPGSGSSLRSLRDARRAAASPQVNVPPTGSSARQGLVQAAQRGLLLPLGTPARPTELGFDGRQETTADTPPALLAEQSRRRTEEVVAEEGEPAQSWSAAAASTAVPGPPALLEIAAPVWPAEGEGAEPGTGEEVEVAPEIAAVAGAGVGSFSPTAMETVALPAHTTRAEVEVQGQAGEHGRAQEQERGEEQGQAEGSAAAAGPPELAAAAAAVAEEVREVDLAEEVGAADAASAGTSAAAADAGTQGRGQGGSDRQPRGNGAAAHAARVKAGKKLRAQPAPRRPGAGLGPSVPGPLLGWLLQGQPPQAQGRPPPSGAQDTEENVGDTGIRRAEPMPEATGDNTIRMNTPPKNVPWRRRLGRG